MFIFVIIFNVILSIINIYIFKKIVLLRKNLKTTTKVLNKLEYDMSKFLTQAPQWVMMGQKGSHNLNLRLQVWAYRVKIIEKLWILLSWLSQKNMGKILTRLQKSN